MPSTKFVSRLDAVVHPHSQPSFHFGRETVGSCTRTADDAFHIADMHTMIRGSIMAHSPYVLSSTSRYHNQSTPRGSRLASLPHPPPTPPQLRHDTVKEENPLSIGSIVGQILAETPLA
jgi:hypothetical protein